MLALWLSIVCLRFQPDTTQQTLATQPHAAFQTQCVPGLGASPTTSRIQWLHPNYVRPRRYCSC